MLEGQTFRRAAAVRLPAHVITPQPLADRRRERLLRIVGRLDRDDIEATVEGLIALLDLRDGDPDVEPNGDELDGTPAEDDFCKHVADGPGCPIADSDDGVAPETGAERQPDNVTAFEEGEHEADGVALRKPYVRRARQRVARPDRHGFGAHHMTFAAFSPAVTFRASELAK